VNPQETPASIDAALTFGILRLDACRVAQAGKVMVEGLKLFFLSGAPALTRERMANLHLDGAKWQLYELENRDDHLKEIEVSDGGIFPGENCHENGVCYFWWLRRCLCVTATDTLLHYISSSLPTSSGSLSALTSASAMESGRCFGNGRATCK
jgi:hypothetical protein